MNSGRRDVIAAIIAGRKMEGGGGWEGSDVVNNFSLLGRPRWIFSYRVSPRRHFGLFCFAAEQISCRDKSSPPRCRCNDAGIRARSSSVSIEDLLYFRFHFPGIILELEWNERDSRFRNKFHLAGEGMCIAMNCKWYRVSVIALVQLLCDLQPSFSREVSKILVEALELF